MHFTYLCSDSQDFQHNQELHIHLQSTRFHMYIHVMHCYTLRDRCNLRQCLDILDYHIMSLAILYRSHTTLGGSCHDLNIHCYNLRQPILAYKHSYRYP